MLLRSPDGTKFKGPIVALKHMVENNYSKDDMDKILKTLDRCGWESSEKLPPGWFIKVKSSKDVRYLSPTFDVLSSVKAVKSYIETLGHFEMQYFENLDSITELILRKDRENSYEWSEERVPEGWKMRMVESANDKGRRIYFMGPEGQTFPSVKGAVHYMVKARYPMEDIIMLVENHAENGLEKDFKAALDKMKQTGNYSTDEVLNFKTISSSDEGWKESDEFSSEENVPFGWKIKTVCSSDGKPRTYLRLPNGKKFKGAISALQYMHENNFPIEDIEKIAKLLKRINWETRTNLPKGWCIKSMPRKST